MPTKTRKPRKKKEPALEEIQPAPPAPPPKPKKPLLPISHFLHKDVIELIRLRPNDPRVRSMVRAQLDIAIPKTMVDATAAQVISYLEETWNERDQNKPPPPPPPSDILVEAKFQVRVTGYRNWERNDQFQGQITIPQRVVQGLDHPGLAEARDNAIHQWIASHAHHHSELPGYVEGIEDETNTDETERVVRRITFTYVTPPTTPAATL